MSHWREQALCQEVGIELFFPGSHVSPRPAIRVCEMCPVQQECLQDALESEDVHGVRGGKTGAQRARMLARMNREAS